MRENLSSLNISRMTQLSWGLFQSHVLLVRQSSSSEDDEDDFGPSVAGKEKRVASERYVRCSGLALV